MNEMNDMRGFLTLRVSDREGRLVYEQPRKNRIVTSGRRLVAQMFGGVSSEPAPTHVTHIAVGTDGTAPADGDDALRAQRSARKPLGEVVYEDFDEPGPGGQVRRVRARLTAEFDFGEANGGEPLREAGVFNAGTGGVMYNRVVFDPVTKTEAFKLTLIWDIVF
jgi:hypothetical protein